MYLMFTLDPKGKRVYTLQKVVKNQPTVSAHPARFSPDDQYAKHRYTLKSRYRLLPTQKNMEQFVLGQQADDE